MRKASAYIIKEGDILLTARSTTIKTAIFHEQSFPCIANVSLIVIRPKKCLNSAYLKLFLDSKEGNRLIKEKKQRSCSDKMIALSYKNLGEIDIPIPDLEKQEQKALKYQTELDLFVKAKKKDGKMLLLI